MEIAKKKELHIFAQKLRKFADEIGKGDREKLTSNRNYRFRKQEEARKKVGKKRKTAEENTRQITMYVHLI